MLKVFEKKKWNDFISTGIGFFVVVVFCIFKCFFFLHENRIKIYGPHTGVAKIYTKYFDHMTKMAVMPINGKIL